MSLKKKVAKSLSWRGHASAATVVVSYIFTGKLKIAGAIAITLMIIKLFLYVYHEKLWEDWLGDGFGIFEEK